MDDLLIEFLEPRSTITLLAISLAALCKFADLAVGHAVTLSERSGIPKVVFACFACRGGEHRHWRKPRTLT